ncbi:dolichyl-P-Man:Man(7)GlcNAc(2)-PP-dolichol alpha-1,6-mannosyltransferase [Sugiyamaella lignohabitans]|uniref:Mannosyltransferase n=1 Tax=Sugiyamaella lignohabitans TaxID=796027 RepID=A0A161HI84_9ASCO|nr:dolichyl-P-Man:Man(7)GlcNAc(2)-PP-dolichol alpha-1,6-mannosyltransferase [Sugiyamaella lignohabitans]ANB15980.1 dolichyl-P-Man:Man(7)GlcNAc(2)-PP-dolichol alpha-1,6-mannosyltransferase [Sugiyamaella lignohabitans]
MAESNRLRIGWLDHFMLHIMCAYLLIAPYTKVEESFNIQAIHDMVFYGSDISQYDHLQFPGVVPRTFVGALVISLVVKPIAYLIPFTKKIEIQSVARLILGVINTFAVINLRHSVKKLFGIGPSRWFMLFTMSQFHYMFYSSRTLPNMFALPLVVYAYQAILEERYETGLTILSFTSIVFRAELALLTGILALTLLGTRKRPFWNVVQSGVLGLGFGTMISLAVDSYFWQQFPKIPEVDGFIFNAIEGNSSFWGEEPYWAYFTKHIPNLTNNPLILVVAPIGLLISDQTSSFNKKPITVNGKPLKSILKKTTSASPITALRILAITSLLYVLVYSLQPHKELRFVIYIMPVITIMASNGVSILYKRRSRNYLFRLIPIIMSLSVFLAFNVSVMKMLASSVNYPGGVALSRFHEIYQSSHNGRSAEGITVHLDVPVCMTGATRFGQLWDSANFIKNEDEKTGFVIYDKSEDEATLDKVWSTFDYFIGIADLNETGIPSLDGYEWQHLDVISGLEGFNTKLVRDFVNQIRADPFLKINNIKEGLIATHRNGGLKAVISNLFGLWKELVLTKDAVHIYKRVRVDDTTVSNEDPQSEGR